MADPAFGTGASSSRWSYRLALHPRRLLKLSSKHSEIGGTTANMPSDGGHEARNPISVEKDVGTTDTFLTSNSGGSSPVLTSAPYRISSRQDLWKRAYALLQKNEPSLFSSLDELLENNMQQNDDNTIQYRVSGIIDRNLEIMKGKEWIVPWGKRSVKVNEQVSKILTAIVKFKDAGSFITGFDPTQSSGLAWAGISAILPLILTGFEQHTAALDGLETISNLITRYTGIEATFARKDISVLGADLEAAIIKLYSEILNFQARAASQFGRRTFSRMARNTLGIEDWVGIRKRILDADEVCRHLMDVVNIARVDALHDLIETQYQETMVLRSTDTVHLEFDSLLPKLRDWIDPPVYEADLANILQPQQSVDSSSIWILEQPEVKQWLDGALRKMWIYGRPGSGKSVMAALITNQLHKTSQDDEKRASKLHTGVVFCQTSDTTKRTAVAVISTLVWQLLARGADLNIKQKRHVILGWKAISNPLILRKNVAREMEMWLLNLLASILKSFDRTYFIVDGLDECDDAVNVIEALKRISSGISQVCELHLLIVSQKTSDIEDQLRSGFHKIDLDDASLREKSNNDIDLVVSSILHSSKAPNIVENFEFLKTAIVWKSDGMILWATLAAKHLINGLSTLGKYNELAVSDMIDDLPSDISLLFGHLLQRCITATDDLENSPALRILQWTVWSARPLHIQELQAAFEFLTDRQEIQNLRYHVETFCSPLITIQQGDTIVIVHSTFRAFVQQRHLATSQPLRHILSFLDEGKACFEIARASLIYLTQPCFGNYTEMMGEISEAQDFDQEHKFFNYATLNWGYHWKHAISEGRAELVKLFNTLLTSGQGLTWLEGYQSRRGKTSPDLQTLQANVNSSFREPLNYQWTIGLFRQLVNERQDVFGLDEPLTRVMMGDLAWLLKISGRIEQAITLYEQLLEGSSSATVFQTHLSLMSNMALAKADLGDLIFAQQTLEAVVETYKTTAGQYAPETLTAMSNLATVHNKRYQFGEAECLLAVVVQHRSQTLADGHENTLISMSNLAWTLQQTGRLHEAKDLLMKVMSYKIKRYGENSLETLTSKHNLATVYSTMGQLTETERLEREVLQIRTSMLGPMHLDTLLTYNNFAYTLQLLTKYEEAAQMYEIGMDRLNRLLGTNNPTTITLKQNLAATYESLHRYKESERLHDEVVRQREEIFGPNHYLTVASRSHLASLARESGDFEKATKMQVQVVNWGISNYGPNHLSTLESLSTLALICFERGLPNLAAELMAQQLSVREKVQGKAHLNTINNRAVVGVYKSACGHWVEAELLLRDALADGSRIFEVENRNHLGNMRHLGQTLRRQGRLREAEEVLVPLFETYVRLESQSRRHRISAQFQLAWLRYEQGRLTEARTLAQEVIDFYELTHGQKHYLAVMCQDLLSKVLLKHGDLAQAHKLQEAVVESRRAFYGSDHYYTLASKVTLALIHHAQRNYNKCEALLLSAIPDQLRVLGIWHPDTLTSIESLSILYRDKGHHLKALELSQIVLDIRGDVFNKDHPDFARSKKYTQLLETTARSETERFAAPVLENILESIKVARVLTQQGWILRRLAQEMEIVFGADHGHTIQAKQNVTIFEMDNGQYDSAEETLGAAWRFHKSKLEQTDKTTLTSLLHLANCWKHLGTLFDNLNNQAPDALLWSVQAPHKELFNLLVAEKFSIDRDWMQELTPLFLASKSGYEGMVMKLLRAGVKPSCPPESLAPLHVAAQNGHHMIVKYLLDHGADVNAHRAEGSTAISYACVNGHHVTVKKILAFKPDLEIASQSSGGALHVAAERGHIKCVVLLLAAGACIDRISPKGNVALYGACLEGHLEVVRLLLSHQPNVNLTRDGILPLHIAVSKGFMDIVILLIETGADLEIPCFRMTPLCVAVYYEQREIIDYLLKNGATITPAGNNIVIPSLAVEKGLLDILKLFLDQNIDIDMLNTSGRSLLAVAASENNPGIVRELLNRGASVDFKSSDGLTAFHWACIKGNMEIVELLLDAGTNIGAVTNVGYAGVHMAAQFGHLDLLDLLLSKGADASSPTGDLTALQLAIKFGQAGTVECLLEAGVEVNTTSRKGFSALFLAVEHDNLSLLSTLLDHGASPNHGTELGISPLTLASYRGNLEIVKRLAALGSSVVNFQSVRGTTALMCASAKGNLPVVEFLLSEGADVDILAGGNATALVMAAQMRHGAVVEKLLPLTRNPFLRDWCGKNAFDWAFDDPDSFIDKTKWIDIYTPTDAETQKRVVKQNIVFLTTALLKHTYENDPFFSVLGRSLLVLGNNTEADHAFQLDVSSVIEPETVTYNLSCGLCNDDVVGDLFVCLDCAECELCGKCMHIYRTGKGNPKACEEHSFHKVEGRHWKGTFKGPTGFVNVRGQTMKEWLMFVRGCYED